MDLKLIFGLALICSGTEAYAQDYRVSVRDVTHEYHGQSPSIFPTPTPVPNPTLPGTKPGVNSPLPSTGNPPPLVDPLPPLPGGGTPVTTGTPNSGYPNPYPTTYPNTGGGVLNGGDHVSISDFVTLGTKVWDFIVNNKPNATYSNYKASVVPSGITSWTQLQGWSKPVSKVYRVEFTNIYGGVGGSFDYRITFVYGGSYKGKGKYIGQISFVPANIRLGTDRSLNVKAELLDPLNFGTEENPVAGAELEISWSSPTTPRYQMSSVDLFLYGTGEIQNLSDGN